MVQITDFTVQSEQDMVKRFGPSFTRGAYRKAFSFGPDMVAKWETSTYARSNDEECAIWDAVKNTDVAQYFVPILARSTDQRVVIQPRVTPYDVLENKIRSKHDTDSPEGWQAYKEEMRTIDREMKDFAYMLRDMCPEYGVIPGDLHGGNVGKDRDGKWVVLDYGNFLRDEDRKYKDVH